MNYTMPYNFETEVVPGKRRNSFLDQQAKQIADAVNAQPSFVVAETPAAIVSGTDNVYTLSQVPISGTVAMYDAGLRVDPTTYTVLGRVVTIATASITGPTLFDYRY